MIREAWRAILERTSRLRSPDPETRARAWAYVAVTAVVVYVGAVVYGVAMERVTATRECAQVCEPLPPVLVRGECYCSTTATRPQVTL